MSSYLCVNKLKNDLKFNRHTMKNIITLAIFMFFFASVSFAQAEKTLIKSIAATSVVSVELPGEVNVKNWDKDFIRVTVSINSDNLSAEALKKLVDFGRYEIVSSVINGQTVLSMPKISNHVFFHGEQINEIFSIEVQMPNNSSASQKVAEQNL
jgi:hypothetical protein